MSAQARWIAAGLGSLALVAVGQATAGVIGFEEFSNGATVTSSGIISSITATGGFNQARAFNTANDSTTNSGNISTDPDLIAAFSEINGGPSLSPGNVLIIQESNKTQPDDNANGGTLTFEFAGPVTVLSMNAFDVKGGTVRFFKSASSTAFLTVNLGNSDTNNTPTNNKYEALAFTGAAGVSKMEVTLTDSGAIDDITVVPIPAAVWLFGSALLGAIGIGSRRRAQDQA